MASRLSPSLDTTITYLLNLYLAGETVNQTQPLKATNRENSIIRRVRMCHTRLINAWLLCGEHLPYSHACNRHITVNHFLLDSKLLTCYFYLFTSKIHS